jgi:predicted metal-dependent hydrolase
VVSGRELHPVLTPQRRSELIKQGVDLFNRSEYFAAHEAWEEIWRSTTPEPRDLFQGLVQLAAAFHHLHNNRRPDVARRVLRKAQLRIATVMPRTAGFNVLTLLADLASWDAWLRNPVEPSPPPLSLSWENDSS